FFFFFSSRRRHTRSYGDWSSDVCSSDLTSIQNQIVDASCSSPDNLCVGSGSPGRSFVFVSGLGGESIRSQQRCLPTTFPYGCNRSEERRVGKECRSRWAREPYKKKDRRW